jgi:hypothetical protein
MKADSGGIAPRILTSAQDGGVWSASRPDRIIPRKRAPVAIELKAEVGPSLFSLPGMEHRVVGRTVHRLVTIPNKSLQPQK